MVRVEFWGKEKKVEIFIFLKSDFDYDNFVLARNHGKNWKQEK